MHDSIDMHDTKHVVSFSLAQELKEAGYPQDGAEFYWVNFQQYSGMPTQTKLRIVDASEAKPQLPPQTLSPTDWIKSVATPLATELLDIIPPRMLFQRDGRTRGQYKMRAEPKRSDEKLRDKLYREGWRIGWLSIDAVSESGKVDGWSPQYGADYQTFFEIDESLEIVSEDLATLPDALAKLWLHLRKKDLIE